MLLDVLLTARTLRQPRQIPPLLSSFVLSPLFSSIRAWTVSLVALVIHQHIGLTSFEAVSIRYRIYFDIHSLNRLHTVRLISYINIRQQYI